MKAAERPSALTVKGSFRAFGVKVSTTPARFRVFVIAGGIAAVISATTVGSTSLGLIRSAELAHGFGGTVLFLFVISPLAWASYVVLPFFSLRAAARGGIVGRSLLTVVAVFYAALLFQRGPAVNWWAGAVCAAGFCVAATLGWLLPRTPGLIAPKIPAPSVRRRRFRSAAILFAVAGMVGAHSVYLRRGWQCVLYIALLFFAFVAAGGSASVVMILVSSLMLFSDFVRLDTLIDLANDRSLAKS